jgi:aminoglycoside/choline kinase family phosphotransferase
MPVAERKLALHEWLGSLHQTTEYQLDSVGGDAGFRRYYRFVDRAQQRLAVDAPPATEKSAQFVALAQWLEHAGVRVPAVYHADLKQGFLVIEDCGDQLLFGSLTEQNMAQQYRQSLSIAQRISSLPRPSEPELELFDAAFMLRELAIFKEWLVMTHLHLDPFELDVSGWPMFCDWLVAQIAEQPYGPMHRDFHSRNLMLVDTELVTIDFQDMVWGPATYDVASLLKDCYRVWPSELTQPLAQEFFANSPLLSALPADKAWYYYQLTGMQRHLKAAGIFARLHHRDGKSGYLGDIPATLNYVLDVLVTLPQWRGLYDFIEQRVLDGVEARA